MTESLKNLRVGIRFGALSHFPPRPLLWFPFSMSLDNSSLPNFREVELNTVALDVLRYSALGAGASVAQMSLSSLLFGVLTILTGTCIYFLVSTESATQTNGRILLVGTVLLYVSTATYMAALIWAWSEGDRLISKAVDGLSSPSYGAQDEMAVYEKALHKQSWMMTIALAVNLVTGDAIVWWRACVIWKRKLVSWIGVLLLTFTAIFGTIGMVKSQGLETIGLAFLLQGNAWALIAGVLSLVTNILATSLIAYKAWEHRKLIKRHFIKNITPSQVLKALALLVESGCIYCALLIFAIVYQANPTSARAGPGMVYVRVAAGFTYGCFVPLVAIYPTIIIVLVALKRSPLDTVGSSRARQTHGSGSTGGDTPGTIVFHHSTLPSSGSMEMDVISEGMLPPDDWRACALKSKAPRRSLAY